MTQETKDKALVFISKVQYLIGELGYEFLCVNKYNDYSSKLFKQLQELRYVLEYFTSVEFETFSDQKVNQLIDFFEARYNFNEVPYIIYPKRITLIEDSVNFSNLDQRYVKKSGDIMTGPLIVLSNITHEPAVLPGHSVTLGQLQTKLSDFYTIEESNNTFVRYDINNQDLSPLQKQNARTNISAVSIDTEETISGKKTFSVSPTSDTQSQSVFDLVRRDELRINYRQNVTLSTISPLSISGDPATKLTVVTVTAPGGIGQINRIGSSENSTMRIYSAVGTIRIVNGALNSGDFYGFDIFQNIDITEGTFRDFILVDGRWRAKELVNLTGFATENWVNNNFYDKIESDNRFYPLLSNPSNYLIESDLSRANWDEAYSWGDHSLAGYALELQLHDPVTIGTANGLSLIGQQLSLGLSSSTTNGALSSVDWNTFNNKYNQPTGITSQYIRGDGSLATLNTTVVPEGANLYFTQSRARTSISLTTTGNSGSSTYNNSTGVFNIPNYTLAGLGGQPISEKGQANGYTPLDANGKVPLVHINDVILGQVRYIGTWNAATNTPTLPDPTTVKGNYYVATNSGTQFGKDFNTGDWVISDGVIWDKVDNTDSVTSVFGRIGNILAVESDYEAFYPRLSQSYANPTWISSLAWSKITGAPTTLSGYGITDAVPSSRTITINGTTFDLSANRTWNVGTVTSVSGNNGITGTVTTSGNLGLTGQALALHNLATNGLIARTGTGTVDGRTITGSTSISVTNGNGVSGNPTLSAIFGNTAGTVAEGNDSRIVNGQTAFDWGNHATQGYLTGTGSAGQVAFWTGAGTQGGDSALVWDNTNKRLGVGINSPIIKGHIYSILNNANAEEVFRVEKRDSSGNVDTSLRITITPSSGVSSTVDILAHTGQAANTSNLTFSTRSFGVVSEKWRISSVGIFQSNGAQTIQTSTGNLTLATGGGNGNILLSPNGTGSVLINTTTALTGGGRLQVNGQLNVATVNNATGDFLTHVNGIVNKRTPSEVLTDISAEPAFTKNTAFNKNFGTTAGTVAQGDDSRIINGQTAFGWGNHANAGYAVLGTGAGQVRTNTQLDDRYILRSGDTLSNNYTISGNILGLSVSDLNNVIADSRSIRFFSSNFQAANRPPSTNWVSGFEMNATTDSGERFAGQLALHSSRSVANALTFRLITGSPNVWSSWFNIWHSGNLRSDAQNDSRYVLKAGDTMTGILSFNRPLSAGNQIVDLQQSYSIWSDNAGTGGNNTRLWINTPNNGELILGPRAGLDFLGNFRLRSNIMNFETNGGTRLRIIQNGNVLIGTATELTGGGRLQVSGDGRFTGDVIAFSSSDRRLKNNIKNIENPIEKILKLGGYSFNWNSNQYTYKGKDYGVIAQEVEAIFPELVTTRDSGYKAVKYERLVAVLIEAVKELNEKIETLEGR